MKWESIDEKHIGPGMKRELISRVVCEFWNPSINTGLISTTSIITVKLFVKTAWLGLGQTSVITVKIGAILSASVKNVLACRTLLHPWEKTYERVYRAKKSPTVTQPVWLHWLKASNQNRARFSKFCTNSIAVSWFCNWATNFIMG